MATSAALATPLATPEIVVLPFGRFGHSVFYVEAIIRLVMVLIWML